MIKCKRTYLTYVIVTHLYRTGPGPKIKPGSTKYGPNGQINHATFQRFNLSSSQTKILSRTANHALAKSTWSSYTTAMNMLEKCSKETGKTLNLPLNEEKTLVFIAWLLERNLSASTCNSYLAGLKQAHTSAGLQVPNLRTPLIQQILEGKNHIDATDRNLGNRPTRLPITPTIMKLLKAELKASNLHNTDKLLMWTVATTAFMGSFRIHELLSRSSNTYDPACTLTKRDIKLKSIKIGHEFTEILQITLKNEKTNKTGTPNIVDVYASGGFLCPVRAYKKWQAQAIPTPAKLPAFMDSTNKPFTGRKFNELIKQFLGKHFSHTADKISAHSFRAGLPSLIGELGYADAEIMSLGRWSSRAFESYLKQPRTKRQEIARAIGKLQL